MPPPTPHSIRHPTQKKVTLARVGDIRVDWCPASAFAAAAHVFFIIALIITDRCPVERRLGLFDEPISLTHICRTLYLRIFTSRSPSHFALLRTGTS